MKYYIYIIASKKNGTIYIGVTNNLERRMYEHKHKLVKGFSNRYNINKLVYFELYENVKDALAREKQLKKWNRSWKIKLIEAKNPSWNDFSVSRSPLSRG